MNLLYFLLVINSCIFGSILTFHAKVSESPHLTFHVRNDLVINNAIINSSSYSIRYFLFLPPSLWTYAMVTGKRQVFITSDHRYFLLYPPSLWTYRMITGNQQEVTNMAQCGNQQVKSQGLVVNTHHFFPDI